MAPITAKVVSSIRSTRREAIEYMINTFPPDELAPFA